MSAAQNNALIDSLLNGGNNADSSALRLCALDYMSEPEFESLLREIVTADPRLWSKFHHIVAVAKVRYWRSQSFADALPKDIHEWASESNLDADSVALRLSIMHHLQNTDFIEVLDFVSRCSEDMIEELRAYLWPHKSEQQIQIQKATTHSL